MQTDPTVRTVFKALHIICLVVAAGLAYTSFAAFIVITLVYGLQYWTLKNMSPVFFCAVLAIVLALFSRQFRLPAE